MQTQLGFTLPFEPHFRIAFYGLVLGRLMTQPAQRNSFFHDTYLSRKHVCAHGYALSVAHTTHQSTTLERELIYLPAAELCVVLEVGNSSARGQLGLPPFPAGKGYYVFFSEFY